MGKNVVRGEEARLRAINIVVNGGTIEDAAEATGFTPNYVRQICNARGVRWDRFRASAQRRESIVKLAIEGAKPKDIAARLSLSKTLVYQTLMREGLSKSKGAAEYEKWKAYKAEGHTMQEVAAKFGISTGHAQQICKGIAPQAARTIGNQYTNGNFDREANAIRYIEERTPWFEYAGNFTGVDGFVNVRCKKCGAVLRKSFVAVRHGSARCDECARSEREQAKKWKNEQKAEQKKAEENKRTLAKRLTGSQIGMAECECCGGLFIQTNSRKYCSSECARKMFNARHSDKRLRKIKGATVDKDITLEKLYNRDGGTCYLCGEKCDWDDYQTTEEGYFVVGKLYPSIEHVRPLSRGGLHSWENVKLACWRCNTEKGSKCG